MTIVCTYFSPTTPGAASWSEDLSDFIRLGSITGLAGEARLGSTGEGNVVFDDAGSTIGHAGDGIVGLKQMTFDETACPAGNQRMWTGYLYDRRYRRGQGNSLRLGADREIDVTLVDVNDFLSFRVFAPTVDDPTSDFNRPAETDIARITALLTGVDFLSTTLFDVGFVNTVGPVNLDANDYTGSRPQDVLNDCAQASGKNYFVMYWEATNQLVLWYDLVDSDGSATIVYDSALSLTNVLSEVNNATVFAIMPDAVAVLDPSRVVSAIRGTGTGVTGYKTRAATANTFAWRDGAPISSSVKTQAKMDALLNRYLDENKTEDNRISCSVQVPSSLVTAIREGMRIPCHFTHLPPWTPLDPGMLWCRILQRTIRQDQQTPDFYWLDLELTPQARPCFADYPDTVAGYYPPLGAPNSASIAGDGITFYGRAGGANPNVPAYYWSHESPWHFPGYQFADAGAFNPAGWVDTTFGALGNSIWLVIVGFGTATIHTRTIPINGAGGGPDGLFKWDLMHLVPGVGYVTDASANNVRVDSLSNDVVVPNDGFCIHYINVHESVPAGGGGGYDGMTWTP